MTVRVATTVLTLTLAHYGYAAESPPPDAAEAAFRQAHAHLAAHRYAEAAALFQTAAGATNSAAAAAAWLGRGEALYGAGRWAEAIAAYDTLLDAFPSAPLVPNALCARGFAEQRAGELDRALATLTAFKARYPEHALAPACAAAIEKISRALDAQARQQTAAAVTRELAAINASLRAERYGPARDAAAAFLLAHPDHPQAAELRFVIAACSQRAKEYAGAAEAYRAFTEQHPRHARAAAAREARAECLFLAGRHDDAGALYGELARNADDPALKARATLACGDCAAARQQWEEAERLYLSVEVLQGCDALRPVALARLAELYGKMGLPDKARRTREELRRRYPE